MVIKIYEKNYKPITKEEIRDFDREFVLEIEGNNYDEPVLNEVKDYLGYEVDEDPISSDDEYSDSET